MSKTTVRLTAVLGLIVIGTFPAVAQRPLRIDDADLVAPRRSELETGFEYAVFSRREGNVSSVMVPTTYTYGLTRDWEAGFTIPLLLQEGGPKKLGDMELHTKHLLPVSSADNKIALEASAYLPTTSHRYGASSDFQPQDVKFFRIGLNLSFTQRYRSFKVHENIGYTIVSQSSRVESDNIINFGVGFERKLNNNFSLVSELEARSANLPGRLDSPVSVMIGFRYVQAANYTVDFGMGAGLGNGNPDFRGSTGITYQF